MRIGPNHWYTFDGTQLDRLGDWTVVGNKCQRRNANECSRTALISNKVPSLEVCCWRLWFDHKTSCADSQPAELQQNQAMRRCIIDDSTNFSEGRLILFPELSGVIYSSYSYQIQERHRLISALPPNPFQISDMFLCFETRARQTRLLSQIELAPFRTFHHT